MLSRVHRVASRALSATARTVGARALATKAAGESEIFATAEEHRRFLETQAALPKGFRVGIDSYSAFFENDHDTPTGLAGYLRERGLERLTFVGLAHDFCVAWSAIDAAKLGFSVRVLEAATRAIDLDGSRDTARAEMRAAGVELA